MAAYDTLFGNVRYACRVLRKTPAFTITAVTTLAVAIGVNTAVFTLANTVLFAPLPYPEPEHLLLVSRTVRQDGKVSEAPAVDGRTWELVRDRIPDGSRAAFSTWTTGVNLAIPTGGADGARYVQQQRVGAGFFSVLGVRPQIGRELNADEDRPNGPAAVVLSAGLWRSSFGGDPSIVGRSIMLRGQPYTVVGVMPDGFQSGERADLWTALRPATTGEGGGENYEVVIRVGDASDRARTAEGVTRIGDDLRRERPQNNGAQISFSLVPLQESATASLRQPILILWGAVGIVLLAASVNLAGLMIARTGARSRELTTRLALGSGRAAIVRQLLIEAIVVGFAGGVGGIVVAQVTTSALANLASKTYDIWQPVSLGASSLAMAAGLAIFASAIFGLAPAIQITRLREGFAIASTGTRSVAGGSNRWPRRALVVTQVALGAMLLVGAGLLLRTFTHLRALDPGFDAGNVVAASVSLEDERYRTANQVQRLADESIARMRQAPGVASAALTLGLPYERLLNWNFRYLDGPEAAGDGGSRGLITSATYVTPTFFETLGLPVRRGRGFDERDRSGSPSVVIINEAFARTYFATSEAVGRRIKMSGTDREIVGIVGDVQLKPGWGNRGPLAAMPLAYLPLAQVNDAFVRLAHGWFLPTFVVRSALPVAQTSAGIHDAMHAVDSLLPVASVRTMDEVQATALSQQRLLTILLLALAASAVVVAAIGIHGLIATSVTERTREMGIRLALGATSTRALATLALPGLMMASIGTMVGLAAAAWLGQVLRPFVWGVSLTDPTTFVAVLIFLGTVATIASLLPTLRILRLDPAVTLRTE